MFFILFIFIYLLDEAVVLTLLPLTENALINNLKSKDMEETKKKMETWINMKRSRVRIKHLIKNNGRKLI